jgi:hypothetical protein
MHAPIDRRHMLETNLDAVRSALARSECDDPVGFVIDATDHGGRQLVVHLLAERDGVDEGEAEAILDRQAREYRTRGQFPTLVLAADWAFAEGVLPMLSPTATESLKKARRCRQPGQYLVVVVGGGGNTYAFAGVSRPVPDGQHRATSRPR